MKNSFANRKALAPAALCLLLSTPASVLAQDTSSQPTSNTPPAADSATLDALLGPSPAEPATSPDTTAVAPAAPAPDGGAATPAADAPIEKPTVAVVPVPPADKTRSAASQPERAGLEEVIVTAQRTAENMQDVPVAISAMSAEDLRREQINSPQDLQGRVPSLVVGTNSQMRNTESPTIRGQGAQFGASPGVVIYMAEVPLPSDPIANYQGGPGKFFDLTNVQILKGSQGTLFGRNTTGGALLLDPHRPENNFSYSLRASGSTYSGQSYEAMVNMPVVEDTLLLRVGAQMMRRDGFTTDVATRKDYDSKNYWSARVGLTWRPTEEAENYLFAYNTHSSDNGTATVIEDINREGLNQAILAAVGLSVLSQIPGLDLTQTANIGCLVLDYFGPSTNCGQDILDEQHARGHRRVQLSGDPDDMIRTSALIDHFSYKLSDELTLRNIASYARFRHHYRWDLDGSRAAFNEFNAPDNIDQTRLTYVTEELQLQGRFLDEALKFTGGVYYDKLKSAGEVDATSLFFVSVLQQYEQSKKSLAPFFQGSYDLGHLDDALSGLSLTLGARYTWDKTAGFALLQQTALGTIPTYNGSHTAAVDDSALTYTAGLDYKFLENYLVYGKISRGYKTGGMSVIVVNPDHYTYKPEFVTNYELGQKADFQIGEMPARVNSAIYYTDYTDLQKAGTDSYVPPNSVNLIPQLGQAVFNVGKAWVAGLELDATLQPMQGLTLVGTYGYTRAQYQQFTLVYGGATPQLDCTGQTVSKGSTLQLSCVPFSAPRQQFSLTTRYQLPIDESKGIVEGSLTYAWTDRIYSAQTTIPGDEPGAWLPSYGLLNASVSWSNIFGTNLDIQIYGTNLSDKEYRISNSNQWHLTYFRSSIYSEPRIVGAQIGYSWGGQ